MRHMAPTDGCMETLRGHERHEPGDPPTRLAWSAAWRANPGATTTIVDPSITIQRVA